MNREATDEVTIPIIIMGALLLVYVGFFSDAKQWVQSRIQSDDARIASAAERLGNAGPDELEAQRRAYRGEIPPGFHP